MRKRNIFGAIIFVIVAFMIINIGAGYYFYGLVIERGPKDFLQGNDDLEVSKEALAVFLEGDWKTWTKNQPFEELELTAFDGVLLKGYYLEAQQPTTKTVVFAHGYLGHAFDMGLFGQYYYEQLGYNIFTFDMRGHGKSGGDYIGFGWHDRLDLIAWVNQLLELKGATSEIVLHGLSMGGATVAMASGEALPKQVKAIVADSPYTSVYDLFSYQMKRMYHLLPEKPILPTTSFVTKTKANYSFQEASALDQVSKTNIPILFIHGEGDTFVPTYMSEKLYEATRSEKQLVTFPKANHGEAIVLYREEYLNTVRQFIEKYL